MMRAGAAEVVQDMARREAIDKGLSGLPMGSSHRPVYWRGYVGQRRFFDTVRGSGQTMHCFLSIRSQKIRRLNLAEGIGKGRRQ